MKNYYADFLRDKNFGNIPGKSVSKVSKGQNQTPKQAFDTFDTALPSVNRKIEVSATSPNLALTKADETKNDDLLSKINRMIAQGAKFDISADDFQAFGLSDRERQALNANRAGVLCTLQQMFLQKHLFDRSTELLEAFKTEVIELSATMTDGEGEIIFEAVCKICADWIADSIAKLNAGCVI